MTVYQITYRLSDPVQEYDELYDAIETLGDSIHEENMCWFVDTAVSRKDIRDELSEQVSYNDKIMVMRKSSWSTNFSNDVTDWLLDH